MGSEFLSKTKRTITKHIDAKRVALATPELFTIRPTDQPRCSIASIDPGVTVNVGEILIAESGNGSVKLRRGNSIVASLDNPTNNIKADIERTGGAANAVVQRVHTLSMKAEISLC
jgi:hypothetical protein